MAAISTMAGAASTHSSRLDPCRVVERRIRLVPQRCCCRAHWASSVAAHGCGRLGHLLSLAAMRSRFLSILAVPEEACSPWFISDLRANVRVTDSRGDPPWPAGSLSDHELARRWSRIRIRLSAGSSDNGGLCRCFRIARSSQTATWRRQSSPPPRRTSDRQVGDY